MSWWGGILSLGVGALFGYLLARRHNHDPRIQELEGLLASLQTKYDRYQERVTEHFSASAQLVNGLTQQYRQLHEHLQVGADSLCSDTRRHHQDNPSKAFIPLGQTTLLHSPDQAVDPHYLAQVAPPRDYADKVANEPGTLDDEFGLK